MSDKKHTAVEWLVAQYCSENYGPEIFQQALQMEREQKKNDYEAGANTVIRYLANQEQNILQTFEQYYNETYGK